MCSWTFELLPFFLAITTNVFTFMNVDGQVLCDHLFLLLLVIYLRVGLLGSPTG